MNANDFVNYGQKVWRPHITRPSSIISVVANCRHKSHRKREYQLKIQNVQMSGKKYDDFVAEEGAGDPNWLETDEIQRFVQHRRKSEIKFRSAKDDDDDDVENCLEINCVNKRYEQEFNWHERQRETIKIVKREKRLGRKVYLKWSKYTSSSSSKEETSAGTKHKSNGFDVTTTTTLSIRRKYLAKKYWNLWRAFVRRRRISRLRAGREGNDGAASRVLRKNSEDNVVCRMARGGKGRGSRETDDAENRIRKSNSERSVIEAQKQKIEEQATLIRELQLIRLKLEDEKFAKETRAMLEESQVNCDPKLQRKAKYLSSCSLPDKMRANKYKDAWEFVTRMEVRASERKKRWDAIKERKQKLEEERLAKLKAEEEKRKKLEEEEKLRKILQLKQERRRQAELKIKQEEERAYLCRLYSRADEHHQKHLLRLSLNAFKNHLYQEKLRLRQAQNHHNQKTLLKCFTTWKFYTKVEIRIKFEKAKEFYENLLSTKVFRCFALIRRTYMCNIQVASDFHDFTLLKNYFFQWQVFLRKRKHELAKKENVASEFYKTKMLRNSFESWKKLPQILFLEREKEQRIRSWCKKVQELLPDFRPTYQYC